MDGRRNNRGQTGARNRGGRPPKADEIAMIERMDAVLAPLEVWEALGAKVREGDGQCIKTWLEYRYGKPKQSVDVTSGGEQLPALSVQVIRNDEG